jgi:hypothetical protein
MKTMYVSTKSEVTKAMVAYLVNDLCDVYSVRLSCNCEPGHNRRSGALAIQEGTLICKIIKCKGCVRREAEHGTV